jgi:formamidopyrimidine-DNA glycosylase
MIRDVHVNWERSIAQPDGVSFRKRVIGQQIVGSGRRGKYLILRLSQDFLLVHLRMSGDLYVVAGHSPDGLHDRVVFMLDRDLKLIFEDSRKFGRIWLVENPESVLKNLGIEPLSDEFTPARLHALLQARRRQLKPLLLDQKIIAGLGNIYTDEALHIAGLHPLTISNKLQHKDAEHLWEAIRQALKAAIQRNGTSIDWIYRGGDYQKYLRVYKRTGEPCLNCGTPIERIVVGQRSTHFCPNCQKLI